MNIRISISCDSIPSSRASSDDAPEFRCRSNTKEAPFVIADSIASERDIVDAYRSLKAICNTQGWNIREGKAICPGCSRHRIR